MQVHLRDAVEARRIGAPLEDPVEPLVARRDAAIADREREALTLEGLALEALALHLQREVVGALGRRAGA